jgi:hypothetical protein
MPKAASAHNYLVLALLTGGHLQILQEAVRGDASGEFLYAD